MSEELKTISSDEYFMRMVYLVASRSKDPRTKIGSVVTQSDRVISTGYNGFPVGVKDYKERYENREIKYKFVSHAEANSVLFCARQGISTNGAVLYTQGIPCSECAKAIIQGGIYKIVIHSQWPNLFHVDKWVESVNISKQMFQEARIVIVEFDKFLGLKGFLDGKEIDI